MIAVLAILIVYAAGSAGVCCYLATRPAVDEIKD